MSNKELDMEEGISLEDILDQLESYENEPPTTASGEPFAYKDLLPMMRAIVENMLDLQGDVDDLVEGAPAGGGGLPPGAVVISQEMFASIAGWMRNFGFAGEAGAYSPPIQVDRQVARHLFSVLVSQVSGKSHNDVVQDMSQHFPNMSCLMPDLSPYVK